MGANHYEVYEVFVQRSPLSYHTHVGNVVAASPHWAIQLARESFLRRESAVNIWVVRQAQVYESSVEWGEEFFANQELDRSYRLPSGYDNAPQWKAFKAQAMSIDEVERDVRGNQ